MVWKRCHWKRRGLDTRASEMTSSGESMRARLIQTWPIRPLRGLHHQTLVLPSLVATDPPLAEGGCSVPTFVDWDSRPGVLSDDHAKAFAILEPGEDWSPVDALDVRESGAIMSEAAWRKGWSRWLAKASPVETLFQEGSAAPAAREAAS
jgi:hypothetical protein